MPLLTAAVLHIICIYLFTGGDGIEYSEFLRALKTIELPPISKDAIVDDQARAGGGDGAKAGVSITATGQRCRIRQRDCDRELADGTDRPTPKL